MADPEPEDVPLSTIHGDLKAGFADLKATLISGFGDMPSRESSEEMVRLLREANRVQEERLTQLDARIREQHLESPQTRRALAKGQRTLIKGRGDGSPAQQSPRDPRLCFPPPPPPCRNRL